MELDRRTLLAAALALPVASGSGSAEGRGILPTQLAGVVELRQYTLKGGRRDELINLFEREFVDSQEAVGSHIIGTFRDLDDPDRFVWIRGFADMEARGRALQAFYGGTLWKAHQAAANATMVDSDNVLLLRPLERLALPAQRSGTSGVIGVYIHYLGRTPPAAFADFFQRTMAPLLAQQGGRPIATLASEPAANNFPRLPVREGEPAFIWLTRWPDTKAADRFEHRRRSASGWRDGAQEIVLPALMRKPERLVLQPTARSELR